MSQTRPSIRRRANGGSAFIITLLALVVLSIILLSLSVITQTERQIATNALMTNRTFYGADSGLQLAIAHALVDYNTTDLTTIASTTQIEFVIPEPPRAGSNLAIEVTVSPFVPINWGPCDGCSSAILRHKYWATNHAVSVTARRLTWPGAAGLPPATAVPTAEKRLYAQIGFQPWYGPDILAIADDDVLKEISQDTAGVHRP